MGHSHWYCEKNGHAPVIVNGQIECCMCRLKLTPIEAKAVFNREGRIIAWRK